MAADNTSDKQDQDAKIPTTFKNSITKYPELGQANKMVVPDALQQGKSAA